VLTIPSSMSSIRALISGLLLVPPGALASIGSHCSSSSPSAPCGMELIEIEEAEEQEGKDLQVSLLQVHPGSQLERSKAQSLSQNSSEPPFRDQDVALLQANAAPLQHYAQDCWLPCNGSGWCEDFCGQGNACCRFGFDNDSAPPECRMIEFYPILHAHTCVFPSGVTAPPTKSCEEPKYGHNTMTLYHQTSEEIGPLILKNGFRAGFRGWCGGAIYFARTPEATESKTSALDSHKGFMIEAVVEVGNIKNMSSTCDIWMTGEKLHKDGYDSITFNPVDGDEFVIYCSGQVLSAKRVPWKE